MFKVPDTSSPPTTPDSRHNKSANRSAASHPSTTPTGEPRSFYSHPSTTPLAPPPSSLFGSQHYNSSFQAPDPPNFTRNAARSSPLKFASSRRTEDSFDAMDEDRDLDDFDVSVQGRDQPFEGVDSIDVASIARSIAGRPAPLREPAEIILATDRIIEQLYSTESGTEESHERWESTLAEGTQHLLRVWRSRTDRNIQTTGIGPGDAASDISKAIFLSSLLLTLHNPGPSSTHQAKGATVNSKKPVPEVLLDWLRQYHDPFPNEYTDIMHQQNTPAANERFWDVCFAVSLRGDVSSLCNLLQAADFTHAYTALEDGSDQPGYQGQQLTSVKQVVRRAVSVFETCPAVRNGDWNVRGPDWAIYRKRIQQARLDLETFAEGSMFERSRAGEHLEAGNFGLSKSMGGNLSVSQMSQRAQSKVPWSVYENLKQLYGQILGWEEEIGAACADWLEATIGMAIWWDGNDGISNRKSFSASRKSLTQSQHRRSVNTQPVLAYQERLMMCFRQVTGSSDEAEMQVNTTQAVEVGLGCIFEGDMEGLLGILKGWSATIANAVLELANFGQWLTKSPSPSKNLMKGFDKSDLMVLSVGQYDGPGVDFDREMISYARLLNDRQTIKGSRPEDVYEGWEMAVQTLSRVRNEELANEQITRILESLDLNKFRVDKATSLCNELDLPQLGHNIAEKYAEQLAESTSNYGEALIYYARAHRLDRVKAVLNLLMSTCLVQSCAYPPTSLLDRALKSIVASPLTVLSELRAIDVRAADLLSTHLSGYATLRRFYDLRDGEITPTDQKKALRPLARRRAAADALIAVIMSAADSIHGGLYDDAVDSVVPIEGLLVLLGEALPFVNQQTRILSTSQIFALLKAIEDVSTVSASVSAQCEECFKSALAAAKGASMPSPKDLLNRSTTDGSGSSSSFSLINMVTSESQSNGSMDGSGVLVKIGSNGRANDNATVKRAWDWRTGFEKTAKSQDVLLMLRLGLAREVSRVWADVNA